MPANGRVLGRHCLERGSGGLALLATGLAVLLALITWKFVRLDAADRTSRRGGRAPSFPAVARIDVGGMTIRKPVIAGDALWSIVEDQPSVLELVRIDGQTLRPRRIHLPVQPRAIAAGFGSVWVGGCLQGLINEPCNLGVILRLDSRGSVTARVQMEGLPISMTAGEGAVWASTWDRSNSWVYRIDPDTDRVAWRVSLKHLRPRWPCCVHDMAAGEGKVWMLFGVLGPLVSVDPQTPEVSGRLPVDGVSLAIGEGAVWVMGRTRQGPGSEHSRSTSLLRVDPRSTKVVAAFPGQDLDGLAVAEGFVWWGHGSLGAGRSQVRVFRFDPATGRLHGSPTVLQPGPWKGINLGLAGGPSISVAADSKSVWLTSESRQVIRLEIARVREILPPPPPAIKITRIPLGMTPAKLSIAPFALWTYESGGGAREVIRIDTLTNRVTHIQLDGVVIDLDAAEASAWVLLCPGPIGPSGMCPHAEVLQLHSATGRIRKRIRVGPLPEGAQMSMGGDSLWIARTHPQDMAGIIRVDPWKSRAVQAFSMPCCIGKVIEGHGDLWLTAFQRPFLRRIDKVTGRALPAPEARPCRGPEFGGGDIWITTGCQGLGSPTILRVDPFTGQVIGRADPPRNIDEFAVGEGLVWLIRADPEDKDLHVLRLDPASNQIEGLEIVIEPNPERPTFGSSALSYPVWAVAGEGALWVTNHVDGEVVRIELYYQSNRN